LLLIVDMLVMSLGAGVALLDMPVLSFAIVAGLDVVIVAPCLTANSTGCIMLISWVVGDVVSRIGDSDSRNRDVVSRIGDSDSRNRDEGFLGLIVLGKEGDMDSLGLGKEDDLVDTIGLDEVDDVLDMIGLAEVDVVVDTVGLGMVDDVGEELVAFTSCLLNPSFISALR